MHQEKYSLAWHTYSDHLKSMMKELMMNEDFFDVTLVTEDKKHIRANTYILSTCSPVFKYILKKENKPLQGMAPTKCLPIACLPYCLPSCLPAFLLALRPPFLLALRPPFLLAFLLAYLLACLLACLSACLLACLLACLFPQPGTSQDS